MRQTSAAQEMYQGERIQGVTGALRLRQGLYSGLASYTDYWKKNQERCMELKEKIDS